MAAPAIGWSIRCSDGENYMSKAIDNSLEQTTLTDEELNTVVGGSALGYAAVRGAFWGGVQAAAPGTWIHPDAPAGVLGLK